jgi:hypothetical protein
MLDDKKIQEILDNGNTAEVKKTKRGVIILEVKRKIRYEEPDGATETHDGDEPPKENSPE